MIGAYSRLSTEDIKTMAAQEKILIIKHGALGDMIQALDGFASVRAGHPNAHLALLTTAPFAGLAKAMPFFDEVIIDPRAKVWQISSWLKIRKLFQSGWHRIYDFQSSSRTRHYLNHLIPSSVEFVGVHQGASHRLGDMTGINNRIRMVMTAEMGGCPETDATTDWFVDHAPENRPTENRPTENRPTGDQITPQKPYAVLIPGCSPAKPEKRWPAEQFAALAGLFLAKGITPILAGTAIDQSAGDIITSLQPKVVNMIGKTNLMGLASLLRHADQVVGNDTGPVFLAARLNAPTIMVMSHHTDPSMSAPYGARAGWIKDDDITAITPSMVMDKASQI